MFALPAAIGEEFPGVARNCELPEARLNRAGRGYALALPTATYAARDRAPGHGRIACVTHWADERGLTLTLVEARH